MLSKTHYKELISDFLETETDTFSEKLCPVQNTTQWTDSISTRIPPSEHHETDKTKQRITEMLNTKKLY